jgi:hypothetical protein
MGHNVTRVASTPLNGPVGITQQGVINWKWDCTATMGTGATGTVTSADVVAQPECSGGGAPIVNYAPMTCTGQPYTPPVACANTQSAVITAFHALPTITKGCYAGCHYAPTQVSTNTYNGVQYEVGSWTGEGTICDAATTALIGGLPSNPQNVGTGGGLTAADLTALATEQTLQSVLAALQNDSGTSMQNQAILNQIQANTKAIADKPNSTLDTSDPDGFEQRYNEKVAETPDVEGGALASRPNNTFDVTNTFSGITGFMNASCPQGPSFTMKGRTYKFDLGPLCTLATGISYMVVALATMAGVKIFVSGAYA